MPRLLNKISAAKRIETASRKRISRTWAWHDPFPEIHGTLPEKMVYAELTRLGIPFLFLNDVHFDIPEIGFSKDYQADFVIPPLKLIIEVNGAFWHSKEKTIEADAFKYAIYESGGYRVLAWWDFDIISRLHDLVVAEPALFSVANMFAANTNSTELPVVKRTKVDTSKGIRTLNARRHHQLDVRMSRRKVRKARYSYGA